MGMFLTKYSMLNALGSGEQGVILDETRKLLSKFKLFALIIHDPDHHSGFHSRFARAFDKLDHLTGKDFLFFGLTDPPQSWRERNERDYFGIWEPDALLSPGNAYKTDDKSISAYTIAQALEIEYEDLPVIVLTDSFEQERFWVLKTCQKHFELQLSEIGFFCSQYHGKSEISRMNPDFEKMISSIDLCGGHYESSIDEPIAKRLSDFLSFIVKNENGHHNEGADSQSRKLIANRLLVDPYKPSDWLNELTEPKLSFSLLGKEELEKADNVEASKELSQSSIPLKRRSSSFLSIIKAWFKADPEPFVDDKIAPDYIVLEKINALENDYQVQVRTEKSMLFLLGCIANLIGVPQKASKLFIDERSERESKIILNTFNKVSLNYNEFDLGLGILVESKKKDEYDLDYSPLIICLAKVFEIEANLSLVHWIRNQLNIEMPAYYNRYKDDNNNYCITPTFNQIAFTGARPVDFNKGNGSKWIPPGIGESELVLKSMIEKNNKPKEITNFDLLLEEWRTIRRARNKAAHMESMSKFEYEGVFNSFIRLNANGKFNEMNDLKYKYRPVN